jgi:hypothetical protein
VRHVRARNMLAKLGLGVNVGSNSYYLAKLNIKCYLLLLPPTYSISISNSLSLALTARVEIDREVLLY